jgi:hypothetical protein
MRHPAGNTPRRLVCGRAQAKGGPPFFLPTGVDNLKPLLIYPLAQAGPPDTRAANSRPARRGNPTPYIFEEESQ